MMKEVREFIFVLSNLTHSFLTEVEGSYQALFSIIYSLGDESVESSAIIRSIVTTLISNKQTHPKRRLNALVVLFNLTFSAESKLEVLNGKIFSFFFVRSIF